MKENTFSKLRVVFTKQDIQTYFIFYFFIFI